MRNCYDARARTSVAHCIEAFCVDVSALSDAAAAAVLRSVEVDIAVDLTGHTQGGERPASFAVEPFDTGPLAGSR